MNSMLPKKTYGNYDKIDPLCPSIKCQHEDRVPEGSSTKWCVLGLRLRREGGGPEPLGQR